MGAGAVDDATSLIGDAASCWCSALSHASDAGTAGGAHSCSAIGSLGGAGGAACVAAVCGLAECAGRLRVLRPVVGDGHSVFEISRNANAMALRL